MAVLDSEATMLFYSSTGRSEISTMLRCPFIIINGYNEILQPLVTSVNSNIMYASLRIIMIGALVQ